ncbi:MAG: TIR domain-containing protein [Gemmatimonadales bacterium]|nr:TIR domain-containing protein [Gemmatimonadales bacterium]
MSEQVPFDVFLSHSAKDKAVVRPLAERLRKDGVKVWFDEWVLKPGDNVPAKIEEGLERSRVLVLCMSANAFGSDWAQLEFGTFRFRDPLNKRRRFLPLRLDDVPIKGSVAQFHSINWGLENDEQEYAKLVDACRPESLVSIDSAQILEPQSVLRSGKSATWVAMSHQGGIGLSGGLDSGIWVWDLDRSARKALLSGHNGAVLGVSLSADGRRAVSSSQDGTIRIWDVTNAKCIHTIQQASLRLGISGDGRFVVSPGGTSSHEVRVWDADSGELAGVMTGHSGRVTCAAMSSDGKVAVSGSEDRSVIVWDVSAASPIAILRGHTAKVMDVAISDDGSVAVSCSRDRTVQLWNSSAGGSVRVFEGHTGTVRSVAVTPDGRRIVSGGDDAIRIWESEALTPLIAVGTIRNKVVGVAVSADGLRAISGSFHLFVTLWELPQQDQPHTPTVNRPGFAGDSVS